MPEPAGLTAEEAERRLAEYGPNVLPHKPPPGFLAVFLRQFLSPFIYMLLAAAAVSLALDQLANAVFISAVLIVNASIGAVQEFSAERAAEALKRLVGNECTVVRDGVEHRVSVASLVPGDCVPVVSGDRVPADLRLVRARGLSVDESQLTGESVAVEKNVAADPDARTGRLFAGSTVARGRALGEVAATGARTELGRIAHDVVDEAPADPPLMIRIRRFTYQVAGAILTAICLLVAIMLWRGGYSAESVAMMVIGLAVSTIPEGLPAALTVALAIGMRRMARLNVIIRKLIAVEALGSCTLICSDKTGTLTVNEMTIREVVLPDGTTHAVDGQGVNGSGNIHGTPGAAFERLVLAGALANESHIECSEESWSWTGDIVDVAFLVLAVKHRSSTAGWRDAYRQVDLLPYESERAYSATLSAAGAHRTLFVKGSPERVLAMCSTMQSPGGDAPLDMAAVTAQQEALASAGYRVLAVADKQDAHAVDEDAGLTFLGLVAMIDPLRPEAGGAVARCKRGGVEVAMVTGDHPVTARAIAAELGLCAPDDAVVTGAMLTEADAVGEGAVDRLVLSARVFARIAPLQKQRIVEAFMRAGHFVAVTGDGVNDAPAMRHANAGVAMGRRGTDVARESADLIIADDNFASIVAGIEQGRVVYNNIRKVVALLVATGFSALALFFGTALAGLPMPLTALQLLWLNLVANGVQDVALAFEPREGDELERPPRAPDEPVFDARIIAHVLVVGGAMGALAFATFAWLIAIDTSVEQARNLTLMLMVLFGNIHALSARSETRPVWSLPLASNVPLMVAVPLAQLVHIGAAYVPSIAEVMAISPVTWREWSMLAAIAGVLLIVEELHKWWLRRKRPGVAA